MEVSYSKKGSKWQIVFSVENIDPSGLSVAGNFNDWDGYSVKNTFRKGTKEIKVTLPASVAFLSFKVFDAANNRWCEVYDNGELYAGLEQYFVGNEMGTINILIPLIEAAPAVPAKKPVVKKTVETKTEKSSVKKTTKKASPKA